VTRVLVASLIFASACSFNVNGISERDAGTEMIDASPVMADSTPAMVDAQITSLDGGADPRAVFEPNNDFGTAEQITPGVYGPIAIYPIGDHDFYKFTLDAPHDVTVQILFLEADGDLDLKLYDGTQTIVQPTSQGFTSNEQIVHTTTMNGQIGPGKFYIEVYGYNNMYTNDHYQLVLTVM
jgi:hypothetical protein